MSEPTGVPSLFHALRGGSCTCSGGIGADGRVWHDNSRCPIHAPQEKPALRQAFVGCSIQGHEDRTATHRARWTVYGGGSSQSRVLCEECASTALARGQRGLVIETLPSFGGVGQ